MLISVLIPSLVSRHQQLQRLLAELDRQIAGNSSIELLTHVDNKELTTGAKRQQLLERARGEYIVFIDDDDMPYRQYIRSMLAACQSGCDCVGIQGIITRDGKFPIRWRISKDYKDETIKTGNRIVYLRHTNHITAVRRSIALQAGFPDKSNAEDSEYSRRLKESGLLKTEYTIRGLMYHYQYSSHNKEYK